MYKCLLYRKPGQTGKVILSRYKTPTEPFQSWSTNITKDSRKILWTQKTRKWFSPGKLSPIIGLLRKCFIQMKSLSTLPVVPLLSGFVWLVCLKDTGLVKKKTGFTKWRPKNCSFDLICNTSMRSVFRETTPIYLIQELHKILLF